MRSGDSPCVSWSTIADAKPAYEFEESANKAKAVLQALELAAEQPEWP